MSERLRRQSYSWGILAEYWCALWLLIKGYNILALRYRNPFGEIDIIARKGSMLVFVEVKARAQQQEALYSVTPVKQQRVLRAASAFVANHNRYTQLSLRFDVMVITSLWHIHHLQHAWRA